MLDPDGLITSQEEHPRKRLFTEADLGGLYAIPATWDQYNDQVNSILSADDPFCGTVLTDNEVTLLNHNGIREQLSSLQIAHNPVLFGSSITDRTHTSHAASVMGSIMIDDFGCELFLESASSQFESAFSTLAAVIAGRSRGVSAEHLAKL